MPDKEHLEKGHFLTKTQLEYLAGEREDLSSNAEDVKRARIRDRTVGAINDIGIISQNLGKNDRENLFDYNKPELIDLREPVDPNGKWGYAGFDVEFSYIIQFFYKIFRENGISRGEILAQIESAVEAAEFECRHGLESGERIEKNIRPIDIEADFQITTVGNVDLQTAKLRYSRGEEISGMEMKALVESGYAEFEIDLD